MANESIAKTKLSLKTVSITFLIVVSFVVIDLTISNLVDVYYDITTSPVGMPLFIAIAWVLFAGTYMILKNSITQENKIAKGVWIVYYVMSAIIAFVILQLLFFSEYYTGILSIASIISHGLAAFIMGLLAYHFLSWFARNKSLVVLLYGFASISISIYVINVALIFYNDIFIHKPALTTVESAGVFVPIDTGFEEMLIVTLPTIISATTFLSFWGGIIAILYANIKRIGKTRFWLLVTTPIIFFLGTLISVFPDVQEFTSEDDPNTILGGVYVSNFSRIIAIALFATAFVSIARAIPHHQTSDYMYIACYGLTLFTVGTLASVAGAGYPPFGFATVSLVGPFSFLLFIGLYRSAISISEDSILRKGIKVSAREQLRLLHSIGTAEMERKFEKRVSDVTKANEDNLVQQSGIEPTLTKDEVSRLIMEAKKELHHT